MSISKDMKQSLTASSWIRKMFEEGARLSLEHGRENVCDFTLGNPNIAPPEKFFEVLGQCADTKGKKVHGYMPNAGYPEVRREVALHIRQTQGVAVTENEVIMTCGAAGALNVMLKAILDPGDTVVTPAPFFAEYVFYAKNHGGLLVTADTNADFSLNLDSLEKAITEKTKAVLINSPNNPTGAVYSLESLVQLGELLTKKSRQYNRTIYLLADEPYRDIVFDGLAVPSLFSVYPQTIVAFSYSKALSLPGERIGWLALHPEAQYKGELMAAMTLANRILGFVNAPALMQRVVANLQGLFVDVSQYEKKREILCQGLAEAGYRFTKPSGGFYLFCPTPVEDDIAFVQALAKELILVVPGRGFAGPGHMRIAFCVEDAVIQKAIPGFKRVLEQFIR